METEGKTVREDYQQSTHGVIPFGGEVAARHRRLGEDEYENVYVVGDVHGCIAELRTLWNRLDPGPSDMVVFVGDLVRKGPASVEVVEFVHSRPNAVSVRGNNEAKVVRGRVDTTPFEPVTDVISSFPLAVSWKESMAVHGGVDPRRPLREHGPSDLLEMRAVPPGNGYDGPFWFELYGGKPRVFFGHTVLDEPLVSDGAVGLDTGCVYGGSLTAYDCTRDQTVSVPAERTYRQRPDDKILQV
ncbi:MAG: metallophosphoesterase family protein [Halovenus sp.]